MKKVKLPQITERAHLAQVRTLARTLGWREYHTFNAYRSTQGFPDLVLVSVPQKRVVYAELKSDSGKVTPAQQDWLCSLSQARQEAYLWRPSDWEQIVCTLREAPPAPLADLIEAARGIADWAHRWPDSLKDAPKYLIDADLILRLRAAVRALGGDELGEEQKE